jgi:hypothetical protein
MGFGMKGVILAVLACVALAGCAPKGVWYKPNMNTAQFNQDQADCKMRGQQAEAASIGENGFLAGYEAFETEKSCMQAHGWTLTTNDAAHNAQRSLLVWVHPTKYSREVRNADLAECNKINPNADGVAPCMKARGYVAFTEGQLNDAAQKAINEGLVSKSVSTEAESNARSEKIIRILMASQ